MTPNPFQTTLQTNTGKVSRRVLLGSLLAVLLASPLFAQDDREEMPDPEPISLTTLDGVLLRATYYAPAKPSKNVVPLILVHQLGGSKSDFEQLAVVLQRAGHSAVAVDLRGHGGSTQAVNGNATLDWKDFRTANSFTRMIQNDLEAVKAFLMKKNNEGVINIEKLGIIAAGEGCSVALNWAAQDWSWPVLLTKKQGQDVKALMLLSPPWTVKGLTVVNALRHPALQQKLALLILVGNRNSSSEVSDARKIHNLVDRYRGNSRRGDVGNPAEFYDYPTSLQGTNLLFQKLKDDEGRPLEIAILHFIRTNLEDKNEYTWRSRD
ncbi:Alpha/beta fold hydrolase [Planctomycetales bacterium 10988]|nr:Alpha/beta fold hydrolase [Planctomycetales bacterium 10988]